jgi:hypothetical protein
LENRKFSINVIVGLLVAHACNPAYSEGAIRRSRFEVTQGKWFIRPFLENTQHKKGLEEWPK